MDFVGKTIIEFAQLDSTNDYCRQLAGKENFNEGTVIWALHQSAGRGQGKNTWESGAGQNLTFSIFLKPSFLHPSDLFLISMVTSLGITEFLQDHVKEVTIKWPNDIYAASKKIAGILIESSIMESRLRNSIIGIGLNVNQTAFGGNLPNPVSIKKITSRSYPLRESLISICSRIGSWYALLEKGESRKIKDAYTRQLYRLNESHIFIVNNIRFRACIRGVDKFGRLALEDEDGFIRHYGMKEVEFIL